MVEVQLGWQERQRATIRIDVPLAGPRDLQRLAFLPEMIRKVKAAGIKVILAPRFMEAQPLGERPPVVRMRGMEAQLLGELSPLRAGLSDSQLVGERVIFVIVNKQWYWSDVWP